MTPGVRPLVLSFSLLAAAILAGCGRSEAQGGPPMAPPVSAAPAVSRDVTLYDETTATLEFTASVTVSCMTWPSGLPSRSKTSRASSTWSGRRKPDTGVTASGPCSWST